MKNYIILLIYLISSGLAGQGENLLLPEYRPFGIPLVPGIGSFDIVDLNGDETPDLVVAFVRNDSSFVNVKIGPNLGDVLTSPDFSYFTYPSKLSPYIAFSDIDGDNDYDLYLGDNAGYKISAPVTILENTSNGSLTFTERISDGIESSYILAIPSPVDIDDDGLEDLIVSDYNGINVIYMNDGDFTFSLYDKEIGLNDFNISCSFSRLPNSRNLLAFDYVNGFRIMPFDGTRYYRDSSQAILTNPDIYDGDFYQIRVRDINGDQIPDVFLSSNAFNPQVGFLTNTFLYKGICVADLIRDERPILNATYSASNSISSAGAVNSAQGVIFKAGSEINLQADFEVAAGSLFEVVISDCTAVEE